MGRRILFALTMMLALPWATARAESCRLALALGLDVSGSVDAREYALQMDGLAAALQHPDVAEAILALRGTYVSLMAYEWSSEDYQRRLVPWTEITSPEVLGAFAAKLRATRRQPAPPTTALGAAMDTGRAYLAQRPECWERTLDISGDGKHNTGDHPEEAKARAAASGLTINALVIGTDGPSPTDARSVEINELAAYFIAYVITGDDAFVEVALGFEAYEAAMVRKLKRELAPALVSQGAEPDRAKVARLQ